MSTAIEYTEITHNTKKNNVIDFADKKAKWQIMLNAMSDQNISDGSKVLFFHLYGLADREGFCFATNEYLAKSFNLSLTILKDRLKELAEAGYIKRDGQGKNRKIYINKPEIRPVGNPASNTNSNQPEIRPQLAGKTTCNTPEFGTSGPYIKKEEIIYKKPEFKKIEIQKAEEVCINPSNCTNFANNIPAGGAVRINSLDPFLLKMQLDDFIKAYDYKNISNPVNPRALYREFHNVMAANEITEDGEFVDCEFLCAKAKEYRKSIDSVEYQRRPDNWLKDGDFLIKRQPKKQPIVRGQIPEQKQPEPKSEESKPKFEEIKNLYKGVPPEIKQRMNNLLNKKSMPVNVQKTEDIDREKALEELKSRPLIRRK